MFSRRLHKFADVLMVAVVVVYAVVAYDVGQFLRDRGDHRNIAEAMAMAGAEELPLNPMAARVMAYDAATRFGIAPSQIETVEVRSDAYPNDTLYVKLKETFTSVSGWTFGKVTSKGRAEGAAQAGSLAEGHTMPWGLLRSDRTCLDSDSNAIYNATCILRVGASAGVRGWYGALDYDKKGGGDREYRANIIDGTTDWHYCIAGDAAPRCANAATSVFALHGKHVGGTVSGIDSRLSVVKCDTNGNGRDDFGEVFQGRPGATPNYDVVCPDSPRLIVMPIVGYDSEPVHQLTIRGWALGYLSGYSCLSDDDDDDDDDHDRDHDDDDDKRKKGDDGGSGGRKKRRDDSGDSERERDHYSLVWFTSRHGDGDERDKDEDRNRDQRDDDESSGGDNDDDDGEDEEPRPTPSATPVATTSPTPSATPVPTPSSSANSQGVHAYISVYASPSPVPTPTPGPINPCKRGRGDWVVSAQIVDSSYSEATGFLATRIAVPRLVRR